MSRSALQFAVSRFGGKRSALQPLRFAFNLSPMLRIDPMPVLFLLPCFLAHLMSFSKEGDEDVEGRKRLWPSTKNAAKAVDISDLQQRTWQRRRPQSRRRGDEEDHLFCCFSHRLS
ncbi:hypothetical protein GW17_00012529 [Ensete ventricosum]|nr:hypothetical protein GW17_00012529 [Ensete ventricosum]